MYENLSDDQKRELITNEYVNNKKSFQIIAKEHGTYANKVRRDAIKYNIDVRTKSEAQSNALAVGTHVHPTKGKKRPESTKAKIGLSVYSNWQSLSDSDLEKRKQSAKENWDKKSDDEKKDMLNKANTAVRESSKTGSKLEKYLLQQFLNDGFRVDFHKEHILSNTKLQIDLFLPMINLAIEVDGPSHFENILGDQSLKRNKTYDAKKEGLLIGKGIKLLRIKQKADFSETRGRLLYEKIRTLINDQTVSSNPTIEY